MSGLTSRHDTPKKSDTERSTSARPTTRARNDDLGKRRNL
ncbi:hypothetical protein GFS60_01270 [Rhodococcus sp. WAY2]|nr:hypothetical protein GFS60_01270 [Rhodococcus sp. WAY2]